MNGASIIKIALLLLIIPIFLSAVFLLRKPDDFPAAKIDLPVDNQMSKNSVDISNSESPVRQQGRAKGINSAVKFEKDFETSLKMQKVPDIWFEYSDADNKTVKVEFSAKAKELIKQRWLNTLHCFYQNQNAADTKTKFNINRDYNNNAAVLATKMDDVQIITPLEKRNISTKEAFAVMSLTAKLAIERYKELQKLASRINSPKISE